MALEFDIELATIGADTENRAAFKNSHWARTFPFGNDWVRLRIACIVAWSSATNSGQPEFLLGLLSNPTYDADAGLINGPYGWPNHFLGLQTNAATWTPTGSPASFSVNTSTLKRIGNTDLNGSSIGAWTVSASPTDRRSPLVVEITKGSPNFSIQPCYSTSLFDCSDTTLVAAMTAQSTLSGLATALGNGMSAKTAQNVAVDEGTDGNLDAVCFAWSRTFSSVHVSSIRYQRFGS